MECPIAPGSTRVARKPAPLAIAKVAAIVERVPPLSKAGDFRHLDDIMATVLNLNDA